MKTVLLALLLSLPLIGAEKTSVELAKQAGKAWACFECAHFAFIAADEKLGQALMREGYDLGREFIEAAKAGKITVEDARAHIPIGINLVFYGPSTDFILGRVFEKAGEASHKVAVAPENLEKDLKDEARRELQKRNAEHLLPAKEK